MKQRLVLVLPVGAGLILRLGFAVAKQGDLLGGDGGYYLEAAKALLSGHWDAYWPPGWPLLLVPVAALGGGWAIAAGWMAAWYLLATALLLRWLTRQGLSFAEKAASLWFWALLPSSVVYGSAPLTQLPFATGVLFCLNYWPSTNLATGIAAGIATLIRPASGLGWLVALAYGAVKHRRAALRAGYIGVTVVVVALLWLRLETGRWVPVNEANAYNAYLGNHPDAPDYANWWLGSHGEPGDPRFEAVYGEIAGIRALPDAEQAAVFQKKAREFVWQDPARFTRRVWNRFRVFWAVDTYGAGQVDGGLRLLLMALEGILYSGFAWLVLLGAFTYPQKQVAWALMAGAGFMVPYLLAFSHPTYHFPLLLILSPVAVSGLRVVMKGQGHWFGETPASRAAGWACLIFFGIIQIEWAFFWFSPDLPY